MKRLRIYTIDVDYLKYLFDIKEMICIRKSKNEITKNALVLYNQKSNGYENVSYLNETLDFKVLEDACLNYEKSE